MYFDPFTRALYGHPSARFISIGGRPWTYFKDTTDISVTTGPTTLASSQKIVIPKIGQVFLLPLRMYVTCQAAYSFYDIGIRVDGTDYFLDGQEEAIDTSSWGPSYLDGSGRYVKIGQDLAMWTTTYVGQGFHKQRIQYFDTIHLGLPPGPHSIQPVTRRAYSSGQLTYNGTTYPTIFMAGSINMG